MFTILTVFAVSSAAWATTYYVDKNHPSAKNSNPGTESQPWRTIQKAADTATAGDTVYVKKGVYNEWVDVKNSGTAGNPITFMAYSGDSPIIDGSGGVVAAKKAIVWIKNKNHIVLDGFEVRNCAEYLIMVYYSDHCTVRNCVAHSNSSARHSGIVFLCSDYGLVENNEVYNAGWNAINCMSSNYTKIKSNYIHDNSNHCGINIFPISSEGQTMYTGNDIMYNVVSGCSTGIYTRYQKNNKIVGNVIYKNMSYGIFFYKHPDEPNTPYIAHTKIYNNTIISNRWGFQNNSAHYVTVKNNIFAYNTDYQVYVREGKTVGHVLDHNLYYPNAKIGWGGTKYTSLSAFQKATNQGANGIDKNPFLKDDYSITSQSFTIDAGADLSAEGVTKDVNGVSRPQGNGFDIGAFEFFGGGSISLSPPQNVRVTAIPDWSQNALK